MMKLDLGTEFSAQVVGPFDHVGVHARPRFVQRTLWRHVHHRIRYLARGPRGRGRKPRIGHLSTFLETPVEGQLDMLTEIESPSSRTDELSLVIEVAKTSTLAILGRNPRSRHSENRSAEIERALNATVVGPLEPCLDETTTRGSREYHVEHAAGLGLTVQYRCRALEKFHALDGDRRWWQYKDVGPAVAIEVTRWAQRKSPYVKPVDEPRWVGARTLDATDVFEDLRHPPGPLIEHDTFGYDLNGLRNVLQVGRGFGARDRLKYAISSGAATDDRALGFVADTRLFFLLDSGVVAGRTAVSLLLSAVGSGFPRTSAWVIAGNSHTQRPAMRIRICQSNQIRRRCFMSILYTSPTTQMSRLRRFSRH